MTWNADDIELVREKPENYVLEHPRLCLRLNGNKELYSYPPHPCKTFLAYTDGGYAPVESYMPLELVPFGCTALRFTYFPRAEKNTNSRLKFRHKDETSALILKSY